MARDPETPPTSVKQKSSLDSRVSGKPVAHELKHTLDHCPSGVAVDDPATAHPPPSKRLLRVVKRNQAVLALFLD